MNYYAVGWFEIYVQDIQKAKKFYSEVFQVELTDMKDPTDNPDGMRMAAFPFSLSLIHI